MGWHLVDIENESRKMDRGEELRERMEEKKFTHPLFDEREYYPQKFIDYDYQIHKMAEDNYKPFS